MHRERERERERKREREKYINVISFKYFEKRDNKSLLQYVKIFHIFNIYKY